MPDPETGYGLVDEPAEPRVLSSERVFDGHVWDVVRERFEYGGSEITREFVDHPGAVAVLAMDDVGRVLLIRQYRHPIRSRDWELPAGLLDVEGEDPLAAAQRELAEEVDLRAGQWSRLAEFYTTPGGSNERLLVYLATDVSSTEAFARVEEEADIVSQWVPLADAVQAVLDGRLKNSILTIAVLSAHARRH